MQSTIIYRLSIEWAITQAKFIKKNLMCRGKVAEKKGAYQMYKNHIVNSSEGHKNA
jgi:hypothetical protein